MSSLRVYDHYEVFISIPFSFRACSLIGFTILLSIHVYVSMTGVDRYIVHMTIDECLKHSDYTRVSLALSHCFSIIYIVLGVRSLI